MLGSGCLGAGVEKLCVAMIIFHCMYDVLKEQKHLNNCLSVFSITIKRPPDLGNSYKRKQLAGDLLTVSESITTIIVGGMATHMALEQQLKATS